MPVLIAVVVVVVLVVVIFIAMYNRLISLREQVRAAWAQIDVLLKRRHDLIPNLVETVKGYAAHERGTLEAVIAARQSAVATTGDPAQRAAAEGALGGAIGRLLAVAEAYPDLKANQNFLQLQAQLSDTEDQISSTRQAYNRLVASYNAAILSFPANLFSTSFGFVAQPFFELQDATQREAPVVKF